MRRLDAWFGVLVVAVFIAWDAAGEERSEVFTLGEIRATATAEAATRSTVEVGADEMRLFDRPTVARALELLPGVTFTRGGNRNEEMIFVRGFNLRQVPLMVDGIPVYVPYDGYVDLGRFTTFDLASVQVSKGWASVLDGPNALGGAVNLVSRKPTEPFQASLEGGLRYDRGGDFMGHESALSVGTRRDAWWAQATASWLDQDFYSVSHRFSPSSIENGNSRENSDRKDWKVNLKVALTPDSGGEYALNYIYQHGEKGNPPYAGRDPSVRARYWRWPYWDKQSIYWLSQTELGSDSYVKTRAFYDTFRNGLDAYDDDTYKTQDRPSSFHSVYDDFAWGGSVEVGRRMASVHDVKAALHFKRDVHREHDDYDPVQTMSDDNWSLGVEDTWHLAPRFDLVAGVGYDRNISREAEDFQGGVVFEQPNVEDHDAWNAQLAAVFHLSDTGFVHASVSRKSRFATMKERFSYRMGSAIPNPGLEPEHSINYELRISEQLAGHTRIDGAIFYSDIDDQMQDVQIDSNTTQLRNVGKAYHRGVEVGIRSLALAKTELGLSYTFLDRQNRTDRRVKLTDTPTHSLFVYARYEPIAGLELAPNLQWNSRRYLQSNGLRGDGFLLLGMTARYRFSQRISFEAGVNNLLDTDYELSYGFPEEGRSFFFKTRISL